jgi:hypothetical protein
MHYILFFVLYTASPNIPPVLGHKLYSSSEQCEQAKEIVLKQKMPDDVQGGAVCISEAELLHYTRT